MKKILLLLISTATGTTLSLAAPRSVQEAQKVAEQFFARHTVSTRGAAATGAVTLAATSDQLQTLRPHTRLAAGQPAYYIYNQGDRGFVIVAGDDRMTSILGYSFENAFSEASLPDNMRFWLNGYVLQQEALEQQGEVQPTATQAAASNFAPSVAPLLGDIRYNQGDPFNRLCPLVNGRRCVTGCVATAMANLLSYYRYPTRGTGSHTYTTDTHGLSVSFDFANTTFDWNNILPQYNSGQYTDAQAQAIAQLMLACGVASDMDYDPSSSGAFEHVALAGMIRYLGYNPYAYCASGDHYSPTEWTDMIKTELNARRPVYFSASDNSYAGHAFILDGYDEQGLMHVDWGWSGMSNGYFLVTDLQPSASGTGGGDGSGFQFDQTMMVGLAPSTQLSDKKSYFEADQLTYNQLGNIFTVSNIFNATGTFSGNMAIVAGNDERQFVISDMLSLQSLETGYGYTSITFSLQLPPILLDGVYDIFIGTKLSGQNRWDKAPCEYGSSASYHLVVQNGRGTIVTENDDLSDPNVTIQPEGSLHSNRLATFAITISNPRTNADFLGHMEMDLIDASGQTLQSVRLQQVYLQPGESQVITRTITMPDFVGALTIQPIWVHNNYQRYAVGQPLHADVLPQGTPASGVTASDISLVSAIAEQGTPLTCRGSLNLSGEGDYYEAQLVGYLYNPRTHTYDVSSPMQTVAVDNSGPKAFSLNLNVPKAQPLGSYQFVLFQYKTTSGEFLQLWSGNVNIMAYTGIESVDTGEGLRLTATDDAGFSLSCGQTVRSLSLYDLQGRQLSRTFRTEGSGCYRLESGHLPAGTYIIRAILADGSSQQIKCAR